MSDTHSTLESPATAERRLLDERARLLGVPPVEELLASEFLDVLAFTVGGERLGLETRFVHEVVRSDGIARLPGRTDALVGFANRRGDVLAIMDPRSVLGVDGKVEGGRGRWLVVIGEDRPAFGLLVDGVEDVMSMRIESLLEPSATSRVAASGLVRGVTADAMVVLDGERVLHGGPFVIEDAEA